VIRWSREQVEAIAPSPAALSAARPLTTVTRWAALGCDDRSVWGSCRGSGAEPYDTMVDHVDVVARCTCPSRRHPCKHVLALLLLWSDGDVTNAPTPAGVAAWFEKREAADTSGESTTTPTSSTTTPTSSTTTPTSSTTEPTPADANLNDEITTGDEGGEAGESQDRSRNERVERMYAGLTELDRWLDDRMRTGLADPALARYGTWDELAARLVDAQAGSLANRIRRLAGLVGASPDWHSNVLAELGLLHLLAQAGRRLRSLPGPLADAVATTVGWQVRQADVLAGVPDTDRWIVAARSDTREDRIEVRRHWLRGATSGRWALLLSFAAYRQSLDTSLTVGTAIEADLHRYPGPALRALMGERHGAATELARPPAVDIVAACEEIGMLIAAEPWLDRVPFTVTASISVDGSRFALADGGGTLPLEAAGRPLATLLAVAGGGSVDVTCEWTPHGVVPLAVHLDDRALDIGPRADDSFVSAA